MSALELDAEELEKSIIQLLRITVAWHYSRSVTLKNLLAIPSGTVIEMQESTVVINEDTIDAFRAGIQMGLQIFGELPFGVENKDALIIQDATVH